MTTNQELSNLDLREVVGGQKAMVDANNQPVCRESPGEPLINQPPVPFEYDKQWTCNLGGKKFNLFQTHTPYVPD